MKVVYFSSAKLPSKAANSIHIMKMCNSFAQHGCDVTLFAYIDRQYSLDEVLDYYDVRHKFKIVRLKSFFIVPTPLANGLMMAFYALRIRPKLVLGRDLKACFFAIFFKVQTYFEIHSPLDGTSKVNRFFFKLMIKRKAFRKLILITHSLSMHYQGRYKLSEEKIIVLPDGADKVEYDILTKYNVRKKDKVNVGYTGHLYTGKGMEIISRLVEKCPFAHFHLVGGREEDIAKWKYLEAHGNITFYGHVNHSEIKHYIAEFDIVLLPNQRKVGSNAGRDIGSWTSPLKLFEYMAMAKPIVCSDLDVLKEVVCHGQNALLCDPDAIDDWVNAIRLLSSDRELAQKIGQAARMDLEQKYTWASRVNKLLDDVDDFHE